MRTLSFGSTGPAVELLQLALNRAGFGPLETDGVFGVRTRSALRRFQGENGLRQDAVAGPVTRQALLPWTTGALSHTVRRGESFWSIARLYGARPEALILANPTLTPENLPVGARITVPLPFEVVPTGIRWCSSLLALVVRGLSARYPFLRSGSIGKSVLGKPLWSLEIGSGENRVLYNGTHHANEWITTPLLLRFLEQLCIACADGGSLFGTPAAELLDYARLSLIPCLNPDGMDLVTGELSSGEAYDQARALALNYPRYPFPSGWKANIRGVDLNLQYPAGWEQARANKFAQGIVSPAPADYVGAAPLTAPESRALYDWTRRFDPALVLAYHSQGEVIYWKFLNYQPENAQAIARLFGEASGYAVEDTPYASGFAGYKDWFLQDYDRPGYTVEVGRGVNPLPLTDFDAIYRRNEGILTLGLMVT